MVDVLLGIVIENLGSFIREELATFLGVDELTQKLSRNLTDIRAVLQDAEQQITIRPVKVWLHNLADAAHVLDDILDECLITAKAHVDNNWINRFLPKKILARRNIVKRMKAVAEKIDAIAAAGQNYLLPEDFGEAGEHPCGHQTTSSDIAAPKVYGRDGDREQVVDFLLRHAVDSEKLSVYSIVGNRGLGKTTLAQVVFNDRRVNNHFYFKIWVCLSHDFSMMKILESIIESTTGTIPDHSFLESMQKRVQKILRNRRYLLVLDNVWSEDQEKWNKFKYLLQGGNVQKGASVLVTTRLDTFASIMGTYPAHHLGGLSDDDIWSLFKQQAFGANKEESAELAAIDK